MNQTKKEYSNKNIKSTLLKDFWGDKYDESLYLWDGAKYKFSLDEIDANKDETMQDIFKTPLEIDNALDYCLKVYDDFFPKLAKKLNEIHKLDLSDDFWKISFGYLIFRHICIVYEKYTYLSKLDLENTSITLLDKKSFYTPLNHLDYVRCFCTDFGVQQLVSLYYYLFSSKRFPYASLKFESIFNIYNETSGAKNKWKKFKKDFRSFRKSLFKKNNPNEPQVLLCGVYSMPEVIDELISKSNGKISVLSLPEIEIGRSINLEKRKKLLEIEHENDFEYFLIQSLYHCIPQMFIEHFRKYHDVFLKDIKEKKFTHIISEDWISNIESAIYIAISQQEGKEFICCEHGSGAVFYKDCLDAIKILPYDKYITTGWEINDKRIIKGGFITRGNSTYQFDKSKTSILYIARTNFPYTMEFNVYNPTNSTMIDYIREIKGFYKLLPQEIFNNFVLRPRKIDYMWDLEYILNLKEDKVSIDKGNFPESISNAKLVIIDHLSTGVAEIIIRKIPYLIIKKADTIKPVNKELELMLDSLRDCGILHNDSKSAVEQLNKIYNDVEGWWNSEPIQKVTNEFSNIIVAQPSATIKYLLNLLS